MVTDKLSVERRSMKKIARFYKVSFKQFEKENIRSTDKQKLKGVSSYGRKGIAGEN